MTNGPPVPDNQGSGVVLLVCSAESPASFESVRTMQQIISTVLRNERISVLNVGRTNHGIWGFFKSQLLVTLHITKHRTCIDLSVFFVGVSLFALPILFCRLFLKSVVLIAPGSAARAAREIYGHERPVTGKLIEGVAKLLEEIAYLLCTMLVTEAPGVAADLDLNRYRGKLWTTGALMVDLETFRPTKKISERETIVGFCGRLSEEKGILQLVEALPEIARELPDVRFHIIGDGSLARRIRALVSDHGLQNRVIMGSWLAKGDLAAYLNTIRLLVVPSLTEGLPLTPLEAMACGVIVLATKVGGLPSVIRHGQNGLLLPTSRPDDISQAVVSALHREDLEMISENAVASIRRRFSMASVTHRYAEILAGRPQLTEPSFEAYAQQEGDAS